MADLERGDAATPVAKLRFYLPRAVLTVGEHAHLDVVAEDALGTEIRGVPVVWSSSAPTTVSVEPNGRIEAHSTGEVRITAKSGAISADLGVIASRVAITSFGVHPARLSLVSGEQGRIEVDVTDHRGISRDPRIVAWASSDPAIVRVAPDGRVTAMEIGKATITATTGKWSATSAIEVMPLVASNLTVSPPALTLELGASEQLKALVTSQRNTPMPDAPLLWRSSDPKIVYVDEAGAVRGMSVGVAKIRVSCGSFAAISTIRVAAPRRV